MIFVVGGACSGKSAYVKEKYEGYRIIDDYYKCVASQIEAGEDAAALAQHLDVEGDTVVISREMGCGVVPIEASDRLLREVNGRVNCILAGRADKVIRMVCGQPCVIKG